jgi:ABC-type Na+ transport system ATPase subunit NatA
VPRDRSSRGLLVEANDLRVDVAEVPACDGLTFRTTGARVLILGAPRALFEATIGLATVARGSLTVRGVSAVAAAGRGLVAGAALDPPMPLDWTVADYIGWSARLAGVARAEARSQAALAIERFQLGTMAKTKLARVVPYARRAAVIASAWATSAEIVAIEDPLATLPEELAFPFSKILVEALAERAWIVFAPRVPLASPLAVAADEAIVATATRVDAQGPPAQLASTTRRFVGRLEGTPSAIASALEARGASIETFGAHVMIDLGAEMTTSELMKICAGAGLAVIELVPIARALS